MLQGMLEKMGFGFHLGTETSKIVKAGRVLEVHLENGTILEADAVLLSAGVRPELELAGRLGVAVDKAIRNQSQGGQSQAADLIHSRSGCCSLNEAFIAFTST